MKKSLDKFFNNSLLVLEKIIPGVAFCTLFFSFVTTIFFRYVLKISLFWTYEVTFIGYFWAILLGAAYVTRTESHVMFTLIFDKLSATKKAISKILANSLVLGAFIIAFLPTLDYIQFMHGDKTSVMRLPFTVIYGPILIFMVLTIIYLLNDTVKCVKILIAREQKK